MTKVILSLYQPEVAPYGNDHIADIDLIDFDDLRGPGDKIYAGTLPDGHRVFVHIVTE